MHQGSETFTAEHKVFTLAKAFRNEFKKYDPRVFKLENVKDTKWWDFFSRSVDYFSNNEEWDPVLFVKSLFNKYGKIYPYVLTKKQSWNDYLDYKNSRIKDESIKDILSEMLQDYKKMRKMMEDRGIKEYGEFLHDAYCTEMRRRGAFNGFLFYFMQNYSSLSEENFITNDKIILKKLMICRNKNILSKLKEVLGDELYIDDVKEYIKRVGK